MHPSTGLTGPACTRSPAPTPEPASNTGAGGGGGSGSGRGQDAAGVVRAGGGGGLGELVGHLPVVCAKWRQWSAPGPLNGSPHQEQTPTLKGRLP